VRPWLIERRSMLAQVEDVYNAVFLRGDMIGAQMFYGRGAGGDATGATVVSDLIDIAHDFVTSELHAKRIPGFADCQEA
jgi:homoserine dehydrogenase